MCDESIHTYTETFNKNYIFDNETIYATRCFYVSIALCILVTMGITNIAVLTDTRTQIHDVIHNELNVEADTRYG